MKLHEYQAKQIFRQYQIPVPNGVVFNSTEQACNSATQLGGNKWIVKCQVHAGGRGKAGGVKLANSKQEVHDFACKWLGKNLVTNQTRSEGQPVNKLLIESCVDIKKELYLGGVVDRSTQRVVFMASNEGGVEIETVAEKTPELIFKEVIDPLVGAQAFQGRSLAFKLGLKGSQIGAFTNIFLGLAKIFQEKDLSLVEVNPLVITNDDELLCLDGKIILDQNALYRQEELREMNDPSQEDPKEVRATQWKLNYVSLDGNIGCMVNGAGLAMGTMDLVKINGGKPANFLDVGGATNRERVGEAFKIILSDQNVKAVLINIFGGIVRCDLIADGIIGAVEEIGVSVPVIVRLEGNNADLGRDKLSNSGLNIITALSLNDAVTQAIKAAGELN